MRNIFIYGLAIILLGCFIMIKANAPDNPSIPINPLNLPLGSEESLLDYCVFEEYCYAIIAVGKSNEKRPIGYGNAVVVFQQQIDPVPEKWSRIYENDFTKIMPWKIEAGDLEGDQYPEIILGVYKETHFDPELRNRLFVFNFNGEKLTRKWTGSQIAGDWDDFYILDFLEIPGEEIIFVSQNKEKNDYLLIYYWFDFGFKLLAGSDSFESIVDISKLDENRLQLKALERGKEIIHELWIVKEKLVAYE